MAKKNTTAKSVTRAAAPTTAAAFMDQLDHPLKDVAAELRDIVRHAHPELTEGVKWNAPSYSIGGDDRITFNLSANDKVRIIFHRGAKMKDARTGHGIIDDPAGLLEWASDDRAIATFRTQEEAASAKRALVAVIKEWIKATRRPA